MTTVHEFASWGPSRFGTAQVFAEEGLLLLGDDFLPWIILALGAAMVVGNVLALVRPPAPDAADGQSPADPSGPPVARAVVMIVIGAIAAIWGIASLVS